MSCLGSITIWQPPAPSMSKSFAGLLRRAMTSNSLFPRSRLQLPVGLGPSGPAVLPPRGQEAGKGRQDKEHAMSQTLTLQLLWLVSISAMLERGIAVRQGQRFLRAELPRILATPPDVLSPRMVRMIEDLAGDWCRLDERIEDLSNEIEAIARQDAG